MAKKLNKQPDRNLTAIAKTYEHPNSGQREATERMRLLAFHLCYSGMSPRAAAEAAGYAHGSISSVLRSPGTAAFLRQERQRAFAIDLAPKAIQTLREVMADGDATASARVSAARTALELAGDLRAAGDDPAAGKRLSELTPSELTSMVSDLRTERDSLNSVIDGEAEQIPAQ